jgi:hypothetical protein
MARPDALPGIAKDGATILLTQSSASVVLPTNAAGQRADYIYVASNVDANFLLGTQSVGSATSASMMINQGFPLILHARMFTSASAKTVTATSGLLTITPLES